MFYNAKVTLQISSNVRLAYFLMQRACHENCLQAALHLSRLCIELVSSDTDDDSFLAIAIAFGRVEIIRALFKMGTVVKDCIIVKGYRRYLAFRKHRCDGPVAEPDTLLTLLFELHDRIPFIHDGRDTLLHVVANWHHSATTCRMLLAHGADKDALDFDECSPLDRAITVSNGAVAWELVARGARLMHDPPPLHSAVGLYRYYEIVQHVKQCRDVSQKSAVAILSLAKKKGRVCGNGRDVLQLIAKCVWDYRLDKTAF